MMPTSPAGTRNSTIITRLSVPTSSVSDMPTETWMSASRSRRPSGSVALAASAKGSNLVLRCSHTPIIRRLMTPPLGLAMSSVALSGWFAMPLIRPLFVAPPAAIFGTGRQHAIAAFNGLLPQF